MNEYNIKVYFEKNKICSDLDVLVQHDYNSTKLNFTFDKEGRVLFKLKAPNGDNILNTQVVNNEVILEPGVLNQVGDYEAEISLYGNDSKLTNYQTLNFYVRDVLINTDEIIEPSHEKEILDQLINDVNTLDSTVTSNEATRQSNEQTRVSNENTRISNETTRQSNETAREEYIDQLKQDVEDGKFDGKDGEDGYTPQKGIDYYTEEEKEEMIDYIVNDANSEFNQNVNEKTTAFNTNATNKTTDFNSNASSKLDTYNSNHTSKMNAYNQNATDKTTTYNTNATNQTNAYDNNASSKLTAYNDNATEKLSAYNTNHTEKLTAYNDNASDKLDEYNDNAQEKIDEFNENKEELQREVDYYKSTLNALPKVEGEGTDLTINDTAETPMPISLEPSELEQETTTGKQLIGYNNSLPNTRFGVTFSRDGEVYKLTGTSTNYYYQSFYTIPAGTLNGQYKLKKIKLSGTSNVALRLVDRTVTPASVLFEVNTERIFDITNSHNDLSVEVTTGINATYDETFEVLLQLSSITDDTYEPYTGGIPAPNPDYPQDIHTISGDNEIKVENINLWDEEWEQGYIDASGNLVSSTTTIRTKNYISIKPNTAYYIYNGTNSDGRWSYYNKNKVWIGTATGVNTSKTTPNDCYYLKYSTGTNYGGTYKNDICINTSNTSINGNYYPHQEQSLPLNLPVENLFDKDNAQYSSGLTIDPNNMKFISGSSNQRIYYISCKPNTTYTYSKSLGTFMRIASSQNIPILDGNISVVNNTTTGNSTTITTGTNDNFISIFPLLSAEIETIGFDNVLNVIQIEQGTKANSYTSYGTTPLEYSKIGDYEDEFGKNTGKNLFNPNMSFRTSSASYNINNSELKVIATTSGTFRYIYGVLDNSLLGKTVTLSCNIIKSGNNLPKININFGSSNNLTISYINTPGLSATGSQTFTIPNEFPEGADRIYITLYANYNGTSNEGDYVIYKNLQLELNNFATEYEPYGNGKWYLKKNVGKVVLDGTEDWKIIDSGNLVYLTGLNVKTSPATNLGITILSNYYISTNYQSLYRGDVDYGISNHISDRLCIRNKDLTGVNGYKNWFSTHNTTAYYPLSTPQYILLNDTLQSQLTEIYKWVKAYQDQTNISQVNNDLPFVIKASAVYDLSKLMTRVEVLESEV